MAETVQQWLGRYRATGRRRLGEAEASALITRLRGELRSVRRAHVLSRWSVALISLVIGTYFMFRPDDSPAVTIFAALGVIMLALGPVGAALEIAFAPSRASRIIFLVAGALAVLGWWLDSSGKDPDAWGMVGLVSGMVVIFGGLAMLLFRWRGRSARIHSLDHGVVDVHRGEVLVFEPAPGREPEEDDEGEPSAMRIEVLPISKLSYRFDEVVSPHLDVMGVVTVGTPGSDGSGSEPWRALSASERDELTRAYPRLRREGIYAVLGFTWLIAIVLRAIENLLRGHLDPRLSHLGWVITLTLAAGLAIRRIRWLRRLAADLRAGRVERVAGPGTPPTALEILPTSRQPWSVDGYPAPWRTGDG